MAVADARDGLGGLLTERPVPQDVMPIEARVHLSQRCHVMRQQLLGVHAREWVAAGHVVRHVEVARGVALRRNEIRVLDEAEERYLAIGDVRPVGGTEWTLELE